MTIIEIILTTSIAIIGYFTKRSMDRNDATEKLAVKNQREIELVKQENDLKHDFAGTQFIKLEAALKDLTVEIKTLTQKLSEK